MSIPNSLRSRRRSHGVRHRRQFMLPRTLSISVNSPGVAIFTTSRSSVCCLLIFRKRRLPRAGILMWATWKIGCSRSFLSKNVFPILTIGVGALPNLGTGSPVTTAKPIGGKRNGLTVSTQNNIIKTLNVFLSCLGTSNRIDPDSVKKCEAFNAELHPN